MITHVEASRLKDDRLTRAVQRAEQQSGFKTGIRHSLEGRHMVQVSLIPKRHWWICDINDDGRLHNCRIMRAEDYERTSNTPLL